MPHELELKLKKYIDEKLEEIKEMFKSGKSKEEHHADQPKKEDDDKAQD